MRIDFQRKYFVTWPTQQFFHNLNLLQFFIPMRRKPRNQRVAKRNIIQIVENEGQQGKFAEDSPEDSTTIIPIEIEETQPEAWHQPESSKKSKIVRVRPVVVSDNSQEEREQIDTPPQSKLQSNIDVHQERLQQPSEEKKETIDTSPSTKIQTKSLKLNRNLVFEESQQKTQQYDYQEDEDDESEEEYSLEEVEQVNDLNRIQKPKQEEGEQQDMRPSKNLNNELINKKIEKIQRLKIFVAESLEDLLFSQVPKNCSVSCIVAWNNSFFDYKRTYDFYLVKDRKYVISVTKNRLKLTSVFDFIKPNPKKETNQVSSLATLSSNFTGLEYVLTKNTRSGLYDKDYHSETGAKQKKQPQGSNRRELIYTGYETNILGLAEQRTITVLKNSNKRLEKVPYFSQIKTYYENGMCTKFQKFMNKKAQKNQKREGLQLDFHDRTVHPSSRNLILVNEEGQQCLVFGKKKEGIFALEVSYPFSMIEGFGIAVASLDRKLLVR